MLLAAIVVLVILVSVSATAVVVLLVTRPSSVKTTSDTSQGGSGALDDASAGVEPTTSADPVAPAAAPSPAPVPTPEVVAPPPAPDPDDPLRLGVDMVQQPCDGGWLVMLASSRDPAAYVSTLQPALASVAGSDYLVTNRSCSSFQQGDAGTAIYAAYLGPFDSRDEACQARSSTGDDDAYIRELDSEVPSRDLCSCESTGTLLPVLDSTNAAEPALADQYLVTDIQVLLERAGINTGAAIGGHYLELTTGWVSEFQSERGLDPTGTTDAATWDELLFYCGRPLGG